MHVRTIHAVEDIGPLTLREPDTMECIAMGLSPYDAVSQSIAGSWESFEVRMEPKGELLAVWGYRPRSELGLTVDMWCLTTNVIDANRMAFARESRRLLGLLLEEFRAIECLVHVHHQAAVRWLKWLGFRATKSKDGFLTMRRERHGGS